MQVLLRFPGAQLGWVQEEPRNQGCYSFVKDRIMHVSRAVVVPTLQSTFDLEDAQVGEKRLRYIGRKTASSSAAGTVHIHRSQQQAILNECFALTPIRDFTA